MFDGTMKIRQVGPEERMATSFPLRAYAFMPSPVTREVTEQAAAAQHLHAQTTVLVAEDGAGTTMATVSSIPMRQNVRGTVMPMAGIAGVAAHPLARRQGHIRALMRRLLDEVRDDGHPVSALYPFRPSFYGRHGYVGLPKSRRITLVPGDLQPFLVADLPGEITLARIGDGYQAFRDFTVRLLGEQHGFSVFSDLRASHLKHADEDWVALARVAGETVGACTYRIEHHDGDLVTGPLLYTDPVARALLLQFFGRHVDQVARIVATVNADERPELWSTDLLVRAEANVAFPGSPAPMARVLAMEALDGLTAGPGRVTVVVVDDPYVAGSYTLDGTDGRLAVRRASTVDADATLTAHGLSALVYGVLDPAELELRGFGAVPAAAATQLRALFPPATPYLFADF